MITIEGPVMRIPFDRFDLEAYELFLKTKKLPESQLTYEWETDRYEVTAAARFAPMLGVATTNAPRDLLPLADHLFDYQQWAVEMALDAKRFALWCDTGLGKAAMGLEFARQVHHVTDGRVLFLMPLGIVPQYIAEAHHFYGDAMSIRQLESRADLIDWCVNGPEPYAVTNYEKFIPKSGEPEVISELRYLSGIVADESGILKTGGGKIKWSLIKSARGIEYKLSCTATPAPNEAMEYASQAAFLEKLRHEGDILWTYFQRDKYGVWSVKPHAQQAFYRFMASWSLYMRNPATFGFNDILATLPDPVMHEERVPMTDDQRERMRALAVTSGKGLFADDRLGVKERAKLAQLAHGFLYHGTGKDREIELVDSMKPERVAMIAWDEARAGRRVLIWTTFDAEGEILANMLGWDAEIGSLTAVLTGSQNPEERQGIIDRFRDGSIRILISKPSLIGYGLNLQFVTSMIFSGIDDSMERRYQAIRRAYRFGQTEPVHVWTVYVSELEGVMFENVAQKERRFLEEVAAQERHYRTVLQMEQVS